MTNLKEHYAELIEMMKHHLLKEYSSQQLVSATPEGYVFFQKKLAPLIPTPVQVKSLPPLKSGLKSIPISIGTQQPVSHPQMENSLVDSAKGTVGEPSPMVDKKKEFTQTLAQSSSVIDESSIPNINQEIVPSKKASLFCLNPLGKPESVDFKEIDQLVASHFSEYISTASIPSDQAARQVNMAWSQGKRVPGVILLSFNEGERERIFLHNISLAISSSIIPAEVISAQKIEQGNGWDSLIKSEGLRLIIASDYAIHTLPGLMKHFREPQKQGKHRLGSVPFLLLSDLSLYLKEPKLKPILWRAICTEFK